MGLRSELNCQHVKRTGSVNTHTNSCLPISQLASNPASARCHRDVDNQQGVQGRTVPAPDSGSSKTVPSPPTPDLTTKGKDIKTEVSHSARKLSYTESVGTNDADAGAMLLGPAVLLSPGLDMDKNLDECWDSTQVILEGIRPRDQIEGLLAVQMLAVHNMAMMLFMKAAQESCSMELMELYVNSADKLIRTFTMQMDALSRHRGKVSQQMVVGRVNVSYESGNRETGQPFRSGKGLSGE